MTGTVGWDGQRRLLQAVLDSPDDDTPRLAYADFCDRNDDPRGAFIRLQIQTADRPGRPPDADSKEEQELLARNEGVWTRPFAGIATDWRFRKGFIQWLHVDAGPWLAHAATWSSLEPITQLRVANLAAELKPFFADPHLLRIRSLYLTDCRLRDGDIEILASSPCLRNLERLELSFNQIGAAGAEALVRSPHLPSLQTLGFDGNRVELLQRASRDWDGSVQHVAVPDLLLELVKKYGPRPWLSKPAE